jgi:alpha-tubulin suppressor-like RCC1 family protein
MPSALAHTEETMMSWRGLSSRFVVGRILMAVMVAVGALTATLAGTLATAGADEGSAPVVEWWGQGQNVPQLDPSLAPGEVVTQVAVSGTNGHTEYALTNDGRLFAVGSGSLGELGNGTTSDSSSWVQVLFPEGTVITGVSARRSHAIAVTSSGQVYAWGQNDSDEDGVPYSTATYLDVPNLVSVPVPVQQVSTGWGPAMALGTNGSVYTWGDCSQSETGNNNYGGCGQYGRSPTPTLVSGIPGSVTAISAGGPNELALTSDGDVYAWGWNGNAGGLLGTGTCGGVGTPQQVELPAGAVASGIAVGDTNSYFITSDGLYAAGSDTNGALGNGTTNNGCDDVPVQVQMPSGVTATAVAADDENGAVALGSDGFIYTWGENTYGALGDDTNSDAYVPTGVDLPSGISALSIAASTGGTMAAALVRNTQTVSFETTPPAGATNGGPTYIAAATSTSGLPVSLTIDSSAASVCSISGNTVSFIGGGTCTIDVDQAGDAGYAPAEQVQQSFTVAPASQSVGFTSTPSDPTYNGPTYAVSASATSGLAVTISVDPSASSVCSISSNVISFIGAGTCELDANQAGNADYQAAPQVQQSFTVAPASQSVGFTSTPSDPTYNGPTYAVSASATSGLAVTISVDQSASSVCSISGSTVTFTGFGTCVLDANQAGNANYLAAPQVQQSFTVAPITILTSSPLPDATRGTFYSVELQAQGAKTPYQWKKLSGSLPKGLKLSSTGDISGTPNSKKPAGTFMVTIEVESSGKPKLTASMTYSLTLL